MSTWLDDIKDPKVKEAYKLIGNQDATSLTNMIRALSLFGGMLNSQEDNQRLKAAHTIRAYRAKQKRGK